LWWCLLSPWLSPKSGFFHRIHYFGETFDSVEECIAFYNHMSLDEGDLFTLDASGGSGGVEEIFFQLAAMFREISRTLNVLESKIDLHVIACMHQDLEGSART